MCATQTGLNIMKNSCDILWYGDFILVIYQYHIKRAKNCILIVVNFSKPSSLFFQKNHKCFFQNRVYKY